MADKVSTATSVGAVNQANVSTSGTITASATLIAFDDASPLEDVMSAIEKAKLQVLDYYLKR